MNRRPLPPPRLTVVGFLVLAGCLSADRPAAGRSDDPIPATARPATSAGQGAEARPPAAPQPRPYGRRIGVDPSLVVVDDGDTVVIRWAKNDAETIRILGIDTAETRHLEHNIPYAQPFGPEGRAFAEGAFTAATTVELLRSATLDPYGRTLGYLFVNGLNYSVLVVRARLAYESVTHYGDNGLPTEAAEVLAAAQKAGPLPFEPPHVYRARMRDLTEWMKKKGIFPEQ